MRDFLAVALSLEGFNVRVAPCRLSALSMLGKDLIAVVLDYNMPGMTAADFLLEVRKKYPNLRVVLTSAAVEVEELAIELELQHWLKKPFDFGSLKKVIADCAAMGAK
jgi:DNA-binding NtrC family response regulator